MLWLIGVNLQISCLDDRRPGRSQTPAGLHHHVPVLLEDDVVVVVIEQDGDGAELGGGAARLGNFVGLQEVNLQGEKHLSPCFTEVNALFHSLQDVAHHVTQQGSDYLKLSRRMDFTFTSQKSPPCRTDHLLDEGVVGGVHAGAQGIETLSITVVGGVSGGGQNPVLST